MSDTLRNTKTLEYLKDTQLERDSIKSKNRQDLGNTESFKTYPGTLKVSLPKTRWSLSEARIIPLLQNRRSGRAYSDEAIDLNHLAFLLWSSQGLTAQAGKHYLRTAPSAGALYPIETYLSVQNVEGIASGLYHFDPVLFQLELLKDKDMKVDISRAFLDQTFMKNAAVNLIWTAIAGRTMVKYGDRGGRYLLLEAAHICQNVLLAAEAMGCASCPVAAFYDEEVNTLLDIDGIEETALYAASIGKKVT
jgi:SagB-type dehydrogenase family enzyme